MVIISQTFSHSYGLTIGDGISGFFYQKEISNPIPGALIVLYDCKKNLLVDYTYTTYNGKFTLKKPDAKGDFYIVATKDRVAQRYNLKYDPQKPQKYIEIVYQESPINFNFTSITSFFCKLLEYTTSTIIGILIGGVYASRVNKNKETRFLKRRFRMIKRLVTDISDNYHKLNKEIEEINHKKPQDNDIETHKKKCSEYLDQIREEIKTIQEEIKIIQANDMEDDMIANIWRKKGVDNFLCLNNKISEMKTKFDNFDNKDVQSLVDQYLVQNEQDIDPLCQLFKQLNDSLSIFSAKSDRAFVEWTK